MMWHTGPLVAFLCSHAISPTIARRKSQVLETALSHHIISALLCWAGVAKMEMHSLSLLCWPTLSLCLLFLRFLATGSVLAASVPRLAARPWRPLTNKVKKRGFWISKGGARVCWSGKQEWGVRPVTEDSSAARRHFKCWLYSSESIWDQASDWNLTALLHRALTSAQWQPSTSSLFQSRGAFISSCHGRTANRADLLATSLCTACSERLRAQPVMNLLFEPDEPTWCAAFF